MLLRALLIAGFASVHAGSFEFSSAALSPGSRPSIDNLKGSWGTDFSIAGVDSRFEAEYDKNAREDFLKEASLSGSVAPISYKVTQNFVSGVSKVVLSTKQLGSTFKTTVSSKLKQAADSTKLESLSATKAMSVGGVALQFEPSFAPEDMSGNLKTTAAYDVGGGMSVSGELSTTSAGDISYDVEAAYKTTVEGRTVSAAVKPLGQKAKLEVSDSNLGVATATYTIGDSQPQVTVKRSFSF